MVDTIQRRVAFSLAAALNTSLIETRWGFGFNVSAVTAFELAAITGSVYSDSDSWPTSPKDFSKIFGEAFGRQFVSGLLDKGRPYATWQITKQKKPYLFKGTKTVLPIAFANEVEYIEKLRAICSMHEIGSFVLLRIESSKKGHGLEPVLEYLASVHFKRLGFAVENQIPLHPTIGTPDFAASTSTSIRRIFSAISQTESAVGVSIPMLAFRNAFEPGESIFEMAATPTGDYSIVGEAKVGGSKGFAQLKKYSDTGYFKFGLFLTDKSSPPSDGFGVFDAHEFRQAPHITSPTTNREVVDESAKYLSWVFRAACVHAFYGLDSAKQVSLVGNDDLRVASVMRLIQSLSPTQVIDVLSP